MGDGFSADIGTCDVGGTLTLHTAIIPGNQYVFGGNFGEGWGVGRLYTGVSPSSIELSGVDFDPILNVYALNILALLAAGVGILGIVIFPRYVLKFLKKSVKK